MGSNVSTGSPLSGILIPWRMTVDVAPGDDPVTVADARPGVVVPSAATPVTLEATLPPGGTLDADIDEINIGVASPGMPGAGAGVAYRVNGTGTWYGRDAPVALTGAQRVSSSTSAIRPHLVTLPDGRAVACYTTSSATQVQVRAANGVWGSAVTVHTTTHQLACIVVGPDGALIVYSSGTVPGVGTRAIRAYRSTDAGATWTLQTYDVNAGVGSGSLGRRLRAVTTDGGAVALFRTDNSDECTQYASGNGGYSFVAVASNADTTCWDVRNHDGQIVGLFTEDDGGPLRLYSRVIVTPAISAWDSEQEEVNSSSSHSRAAALAYDSASGTTYALSDAATSYEVVAFRKLAREGWIWDEQYGPAFATATTGGGWAAPTAAFVRGTLVVVGRSDGNGGGAVALWEIRYGGNSNATIGSALSQDGFASSSSSFIPIGTLVNAGWPTADSGAPTRTLSATTGQRIQTGVGESAVHDSALLVTGSVGIFRFVVRVVSAGAFLRCISPGAAIEIQITSTQIRAYDHTVGPSGSFVTHGITGYIEVIAIVDSSTSAAFVTYRAYDTASERALTDLPALTSLGASGVDVRAKITVSASGDVYVYEAHFVSVADTTLAGGWARPTGLDAIPLSGLPSYLGRGVDVAMTGGAAVVDGVTLTAERDSVYRLANILPQTSPSPRAAWRSADLVTDETITLLLDHPDAPQVVAIYLDGLVGVSAINVTAGLPVAALDMSTVIRYDRSGGAIVPTTTGTRTLKSWVKADELVGWYLADSSGGVARITGNSEGSLTFGASGVEHRAAIYVGDGLVTTGTDIAGTLYPSRALLVGRLEAGDTVASVTLEIVAGDQFDPPEGYRSIGLVAAGRVHVFGIGPDLNDSLTMLSAADVQTGEGGQRYSTRRHEDRRVVEIAFVGSPHEARQMFGATTSPDYVVARTGGPAAASQAGIPLVVEGITRRAAHESDGLVVWIPTFRASADEGWTGTAFGLDACVYGRITSEFRREAIQYVGERGRTQIFRVSQLRIEEEL